jgi:hypothetical protein
MGHGGPHGAHPSWLHQGRESSRRNPPSRSVWEWSPPPNSTSPLKSVWRGRSSGGTRTPLPTRFGAAHIRGAGEGEAKGTPNSQASRAQNPKPRTATKPLPPRGLSPIAVGHPSSLSPIVGDFSPLSPVEPCPSSTLIPSVTRKYCRIFTDIFCVVVVLDHTLMR